MLGLDEWIADLAQGSVLLLVAAVAILLGLRHATDPDHLTAVITLMAGDDRQHGRSRQAARLGLAWGGGHATTLILLGLPIVLFDAYLPDAVQRGAEVLVGVVIIALAVRLLMRLWRTRAHDHPHSHGSAWHRHRHVHERRGKHDHAHPAPLMRSVRQAFGIGLIHGIGGSAGVGVLLLAAIPDAAAGIAALVLFASCSAVSMAVVSTCFGVALSGRADGLRARLTPAVGLVSLAFGTWYVLGAAQLVPYLF